jgi:dTDP-4-amino-4,6-dideoxygalactose transaminase
MKTISLFNAYNSVEIESVTNDVLRSGFIASGQYVNKFENGLSSLLGINHVITTVDMTSAIHLALYLSGVKKGDEVLTTSFACMATNSPIAALGAKAVWVDLEPHSVFIDPVKFEQAITSKTKAAIIYHVAGYPGHIKKLSLICKKYNISLIEDCNNALLSKVGERYVGSFGDFSIFSFYPNRQINAFEGGALVCKDSKNADKAKKMRRFGIDFNTFRTIDGEINPKSDIPEVGWSMSLSNLCSAAGNTQLDTVESRVDKARENASILTKSLTMHDNIRIIHPLEETNPAYWVYLIEINNPKVVMNKLKEEGIHVSSLHHRNDQYSCFSTTPLSEFSNTRQLQDSIIALPCGWWLDENEIKKIVTTLIKAISVC